MNRIILLLILGLFSSCEMVINSRKLFNIKPGDNNLSLSDIQNRRDDESNGPGDNRLTTFYETNFEDSSGDSIPNWLDTDEGNSMEFTQSKLGWSKFWVHL
jgi:hypothetical protein